MTVEGEVVEGNVGKGKDEGGGLMGEEVGIKKCWGKC